jgi:hypothetical protein
MNQRHGSPAMSLAAHRRRNGVRVNVVLQTDKPDLDLVDELARLQACAQRLGWSVVMRVDSAELIELLDVCGLADVVSVEVVGQPEKGEERLGLEEVVMPDDPFA